MTDHTNLIARLRDATTGNLFADREAAADALEALQGEIKWITQANAELRAELTEEQEEVATLWKQVAAMAEREIALQARLTALEGQEPVAWKYQEATHPEGDLRGRGWRFHQFSMSKPNRPWMQDDVIPLYLASGAAPQQAEPKEGA